MYDGQSPPAAALSHERDSACLPLYPGGFAGLAYAARQAGGVGAIAEPGKFKDVQEAVFPGDLLRVCHVPMGMG